MASLLDFPGGSESKASLAYNAGDLGSFPGLGRSPGEGNGNPLQYSCLENPTDGGAWQATGNVVAKNWTRLRDFTFFLHKSIKRDKWVNICEMLSILLTLSKGQIWWVSGVAVLVLMVMVVSRQWSFSPGVGLMVVVAVRVVGTNSSVAVMVTAVVLK